MQQPNDDPFENPSPETKAREKTWAIASLSLLLILVAGMLWTFFSFSHQALPPVGPVDHGPLPVAVRQQVIALLTPHVDHLEFTETLEGGARDFHIKGRSRALLAKEFRTGFNPVVVNQVMPLLRPYGEVISIEIDNLEFYPVRLREFPKGP